MSTEQRQARIEAVKRHQWEARNLLAFALAAGLVGLAGDMRAELGGLARCLAILRSRGQRRPERRVAA